MKKTITILITLLLILLLCCSCSSPQEQITSSIQKGLGFSDTSALSVSDFTSLLSSQKISSYSEDEPLFDSINDTASSLISNHDWSSFCLLVESLDCAGYHNNSLLTAISNQLSQLSVSDILSAYSNLSAPENLNFYAPCFDISEESISSLTFSQKCTLASQYSWAISRYSILTPEDVELGIANYSFAEKLALADHFATHAVDLPVISRTDVDEYTDANRVVIYSERNSENGYYSTHSYRNLYRDIQSDGDIITTSWSYFGDFALQHYEREYLDPYYQIHTSTRMIMYFRDKELPGLDTIDEMIYAPPYLFSLVGNNVQIYDVDTSTTASLIFEGTLS